MFSKGPPANDLSSKFPSMPPFLKCLCVRLVMIIFYGCKIGPNYEGGFGSHFLVTLE